MPPRRRRDAEEGNETEPEGEDNGNGKGNAPARNLRLSAQSTAVPGKKTQLKSLPSKHTTSYGSPAPVLPLQGAGAGSTDLKTVTRGVFAAVQRDNKRAKLQHEAAQADELGEPVRVTRSRSAQSSRETTPVTEDGEPDSKTRASKRVTRARSRQISHPPTPVPEVEEPESEPEEEPEEETRAARPAAEALNSSSAIEAELRRLQAAREERERKVQEENERRKREQRERAAREEEERAARERAQQEEQARIEREQRERSEREERERVKKEEKERAARERAERKEKDRLAREAKERAQREERERAEREQRERIERERQEQAERQEREQRERARAEAERAEKERIEREQREQAEQHERERAAREQARQAQPEREAAAARTREEFERQVARANKQRHEENRAKNQAATGGLGPAEPAYRPPKKRTGDEFLDATFSPKRPRNDKQPPASAAVSMRSYIEESHVYREADLQTPAPSSVVNTPSRAPPQPAVAPTHADPRASNLPSHADDVWLSGMPAPRAPPRQPAPQLGSTSQGGPSRAPEVRPRPSRPVFATTDDDDDEGPVVGPSVTPRRSDRQAARKLDLAPNRRKSPPNDPAADEQPRGKDRGRRRDDSSASDSEPPSPSGGKDGPGRPQKTGPLRPRDQAARPSRGRAPPGDSPPPDDASSLGDQFRKAWKDWRHYLWHALRWLGYGLAFLLALNIVFLLWHKIGSSDWETRGNYGLEWYGWNHMGRNIGQLIPYDLRHPLGFLDDSEYSALRDHIYSQDGKIIKLTDQANDVRQATQKLEGILPRVVSVKQDKKTSKLVIQQDFWHALKDLMHAEKSILTLERGKDGMSDISDEHWVAVLKRLKARGVLTTKDVDGIVQGAVSSSWENWLRNNRGKVDKVLGSSPGQPLSPDAEKQIEKLIREKVSGPGLRDVVVTRDEFIREVQRSINAHKREAEAELAQVQDTLKAMIEAARKAASESSGGMSRREVIALTNDLIQTAISNARLEGAAKGSISNNFELDLSRRINYFALGNGAMIEKSLTSPSYKPPLHKHWFGSADWVKAKLAAPRFIADEAAALSAWEEAGHCWCAGNRFESPSPSFFSGAEEEEEEEEEGEERVRPVDINVRLARAVTPENVVLEHIDPAATIDPGAMPKDLEVWAHVDEHTQHQRARDFMLAAWPDTPRDHPLLGRNYLKIGEFRYEYDRATGGVLVYRVSEELKTLGVSTDLVLVRAVSNWGADHTCFYRVRLYGTPVEGKGDWKEE